MELEVGVKTSEDEGRHHSWGVQSAGEAEDKPQDCMEGTQGGRGGSRRGDRRKASQA